MNLTEIIRNPPTPHREFEGGEYFGMGVTEEVLNFISEHVDASSHTLETGCGLSTTVLALLGARHICITPAQSEIERVQDYCRNHGIATDGITFYPHESETVLPKLSCAPLDLVLIDGRHGFPAPFIDFYYTAGKLKIGGLLVIDDTWLWTGDVLKQILLLEPEWQLEADFAPRACVFRKLANETQSKEWTQQPFVVLNSEYKLTSKPVPYAVTAFRYISRGEFSVLGKVIARKLGMLKKAGSPTLNRTNLLTLLDGISSRRRNLHLPSTRLGRTFRDILTREGVCVNLDGVSIWGSLEHEYYFLDSLRGATWEQYTGELFRKALRSGIRVLDIGANIGYYTLVAAKAGATVQAFEPDPRNLHYLLRNLRCNRLDHRVTVVQKAVSDEVGFAVFYQHESLLESSLFRELQGEPTTVECTTIDAYVNEDVIIELVKIDIEGAELSALKGMDQTIARAGKSLKMFIECYPAGLKAAGASPEMLVDWLASRDFKIMAIDEKDRCLRPLDSIDLKFPKFQNELVRAFNLYCVRNGPALPVLES